MSVPSSATIEAASRPDRLAGGRAHQVNRLIANALLGGVLAGMGATEVNQALTTDYGCAYAHAGTARTGAEAAFADLELPHDPALAAKVAGAIQDLETALEGTTVPLTQNSTFYACASEAPLTGWDVAVKRVIGVDELTDADPYHPGTPVRPFLDQSGVSPTPQS